MIVNAVEAQLSALEKQYEEGLLLWVGFCDAVVEQLFGRRTDDYSLHGALTPKAISRVVEAMNVMKSAAVSGEPVLSVGSSAETYDHTAKIPRYLALADAWQAAGWIELGEVVDGVQGWTPIDKTAIG